MTLRTCADCSTQYAVDLASCPHCGSSDTTEGGAVVKRFSLFVTLSCPECGRGPWTVRLQSVTSGLLELPTLACTSCGSRVPVTWPPEEEPMSPKITVLGGATNAHGADVSPAADVSQPQVAAEGDLGRPTLDEHEAEATSGEALPEAPAEEVRDEGAVPAAEAKDYSGMTLAELREEAEDRGIPSYGTKAQITDRLQEADATSETPAAEESAQ